MAEKGVTKDLISNIKIVEHETYFFTYTFPIYRGLCVVALYVGILGLNELFYNSYQVNYRKLLGIDFSINPKRVLRKVLVFLIAFFIFFIWY